jgi:hypothetical protein
MTRSMRCAPDAAREVLRQGRGSELAKIYVKSAYRTVPIHPDDRWLLGMRWEESLFVDTALPFGLRSAPKIFTAIADAVEWILKQAQICDPLPGQFLSDWGTWITGMCRGTRDYECNLWSAGSPNCHTKAGRTDLVVSHPKGEDNITLKELLPVVLACATWGREWRNSTVVVHCDNAGAVAAVNSGYSRVPQIVHLLRCLFFITSVPSHGPPGNTYPQEVQHPGCMMPYPGTTSGCSSGSCQGQQTHAVPCARSYGRF